MLAWALSVLLCFVILIGFMFIGDSDGINILSYCFTNLMLCFFLYAVSGKEPFERCGSQLGYVMKNGWPVLVFPLIFFFFGIVGSFTGDARLNTDWPVRLGMGFLLMMLAGLSEELGFRAVASDALLLRLRNTRHPSSSDALRKYRADLNAQLAQLCCTNLRGLGTETPTSRIANVIHLPCLPLPFLQLFSHGHPSGFCSKRKSKQWI